MAWWFFFPIAFFGGFILILVLISLAAWTLFSARWRISNSVRGPDTALQITRERYAKGELTKECDGFLLPHRSHIFSLPHRRKTGRWRDGCGLQGRRHPA